MADTSLTRTYNSLLTLTLDALRPILVDNIFKGNKIIAILRDRGRFNATYDGGERIKRQLMYGKNSTFKSYTGYGVVDTTPQEGITAAFYEWTEIAGTISMSRRELRQNSGKAAIMSLLEAKTRQAMMSMIEELNRQVMSGTISGTAFIQGNSSQDLISIPELIPKDSTAATVGSISRANESWWRSVATSSSATTWATLRAELYTLYNDCSKGSIGGSPKLGIADQTTFETYELSLNDQKRYIDAAVASLGFETIMLKSAALVWDEMVPDMQTPANEDTGTKSKGSLFLINDEFMELSVDKESNVVTTPFLENQNQTAISAKVLFMGQLTVDNMRKHGLLYNISQSITS